MPALPHLDRLDTYVERVAISPDGALTSEDIDDLCHDLKVRGDHPDVARLLS